MLSFMRNSSADGDNNLMPVQNNSDGCVGLYARDTIAAISTPLGYGGIGIVRMSGEQALTILLSVFVLASKKKIKSHTLTYGNIVDNGRVIDEVMVGFMAGPRSYTREDVVEINCHGGLRSVEAILELVLKNGARLAEPGEFTKRAFLNGRLDLSQAEAVINVINAKTKLSLNDAVKQLGGAISRKINYFRSQLLTLLANIEVSIDYPEHDDETMNLSEVAEKSRQLLKEMQSLLDTADYGRIIQEGVLTVILGKPNVGKSTLLNATLGEDRAIVTNIPGTTRDSLSEYVSVGGLPLRLVDTAGLRNTDDVIEKIGVDKARELAEKAQLILLMLDSSSKLSEDDRQAIQLAKSVSDAAIVVILNKTDLPQAIELDQVNFMLPDSPKIFCSLTGQREAFNKKLFDCLQPMFMSNLSPDKETISNLRQKTALSKATASLQEAIEAVDMGITEDLVAMSLQEAYGHLGEITGETISLDIVSEIFSTFCVGK